MVDILLFRPKVPGVITDRCSLGLVYIATYLANKGFKVKLIDEVVTPNWHDELQRALDPSIICAGVSVMTGRSIQSALEFSKEVKEQLRVPVVWGGIHPSLLPEQTLKNAFVDIVVIGDGERVFFEIIDCMKNKRKLDQIKGIGLKENGRIHCTEPETHDLNLNELPPPDFHFIDVEHYKKAKRSFTTNHTLDLNVDRGCPFRCAFCYNIQFNKRRWRAIEADKVVDMVETLSKEYRLGGINFVSDNFFVDKHRVRKICQMILDRHIDIRWHTDMRVDTFLHYEDDLIRLIKASGCSEITFGVESGSNRTLKMISKDITIEDVFRSHKRALSFDFKINYHFMIGFPEETKEDILGTVQAIRTLTKNKHVNIYGPSVYTPYPGTPLYDRCCEMGFIPPQDLEDWISYDWDMGSMLPWFSKTFKSFINEVQLSCKAANYYNETSNPFLYLVGIYGRLKLTGLVNGIRLFEIDSRLMQFFKKVIVKIANLIKVLQCKC